MNQGQKGSRAERWPTTKKKEREREKKKRNNEEKNLGPYHTARKQPTKMQRNTLLLLLQ